MEMNIDHHISSKFNEELEEIRTRALQMGGAVEKQLANALAAISKGDLGLAKEVVASDYLINAQEVEIDEQCTQILATRQPAARDLRLIVAVIKTITDLERMGDEAQRVGRMAKQLVEHSYPSKHFQQIRNLGNHVSHMLHDALDAFARTDMGTALRVLEEDERVDQEYEAIMRQLITFMMEDPRSIPRSLEIMWSARALERIGDRSCNIAEYVIYFVRGRDIRHTELSDVQDDLD